MDTRYKGKKNHKCNRQIKENILQALSTKQQTVTRQKLSQITQIYEINTELG